MNQGCEDRKGKLAPRLVYLLHVFFILLHGYIFPFHNSKMNIFNITFFCTPLENNWKEFIGFVSWLQITNNA